MRTATTAQRLKEIMHIRGIRQVDILRLAAPYCKQYDVSLGSNDLSQYVSGKVEPGQFKLTILGLALGVNEAWLMGYDVPMERSEPTSAVDTSNDPDIRILERARETMADEDWQKLMNAIKALHPEFFD